MPSATVAASDAAKDAVLASLYYEAKEGTLEKWVDGLPDHLYHDHKLGYSSSDLKTLLKKSPEYLKWRLDNPMKATPAMALGSAVHSMVLTPHETIHVEPDVDRRTKAGKEELASFQRGIKRGQDLVVSNKQYEEASRMSHAIFKNKLADELLTGGVAEQSLFFKTPISDLQFRARPDYFTPDYMVELKTSKDASPQAFAKDIANLYYHVSLAHYLFGIEQIHNKLLTDVYFIVVENSEPYSVGVYKVSERMLQVGKDLWSDAVQRLDLASSNNSWGGYNGFGIGELELEEIDLPGWAVPYEKVDE